MASDVGIKLELTAVDKISAKLKKITQQLDKFEANVKKSIPTINKLSNSVDKLGNALNSKVSASFKNIEQSVKGSNSSFKKFKGTVDKVSSNSKKFTNQSKKLSNASKKLTSNVKKTNSKFKEQGKAVNDLHPRLARYVKGLGGVAVKLNAMTVGISLAITGLKKFGDFMANAVKSAGDVEYALQEVANITGKTGQALEEMKQVAINVGEATKFTTKDMLEAQKNLGQLGLISAESTTAEIDKLTKTVGYYAVTSNRTIQQSAEDIGALVSAIGDPADELADKMTYMANTTQISFNEFKHLAKYGTLAKTLKQNTDNLFAMTAAYRKVAPSTRRATTHIVGFGKALMAVHKNSAKLAEMKSVAKAIGKTDIIYDANGNMREMIDIIADLKKGYESMGYTQEQIATSMGKMFNSTAANVYFGVVAEGIDNVKEQSNRIGTESVGMVEKNAEKMGNTFNGLVDRIKGKLENMQTQIGETIMPMAKQSLDKFLTALNNVDIKQIGTLIQKVVSPLFDTFTVAINQINTSFVPLINKILTAIQPMTNSALRLVSEVLPSIASLLGGIVPLVEVISDIIATIIEGLTPFLKNLFSGLAPVLTRVTGIIKQIWEIVKPIVDLAFELFNESLKPIFDIALPLIVAALDQISGMLEPIKPIIQIIADILGFIFDIINAIGSALTGWVKGLLGISKSVEEAQSDFDDIHQKAVDIKEQLQSFEDIGIKDGFTAEMAKDLEGLKSKVEEVKQKFPELGAEMELIANSQYLNLNEKVDMLNESLNEFKDINLNVTSKEKEDALENFFIAQRDQFDIIMEKQIEFDKLTEKGMDNLSEKSKKKALTLEKDIKVMSSRIQEEVDKLGEIGVDYDLLNKKSDRSLGHLIKANEKFWSLTGYEDNQGGAEIFEQARDSYDNFREMFKKAVGDDPVSIKIQAKTDFENIFNKVKNIKADLQSFEDIGIKDGFTTEMINNMEGLKDTVEQVKQKFPELGKEMETIADSELLNASDKVKLMNKSLNKFKKDGLDFVDQKEVLKDFDLMTDKVYRKLHKKANEYKELTKDGIENLTAENKLEAEKLKKEITAITKDSFKEIEKLKLFDISEEKIKIRKTVFNPLEIPGKVIVDPDAMREDIESAGETAVIKPEIDLEAVKQELEDLFATAQGQMNLDVKIAEYNDASIVRVNQIKAEGLTELIDLKEQEISKLGTSIQRETELIDLMQEKKNIMSEISPENFLQQFADNLTEQYKIMEKDVNKLVDLEDKIMRRRQSIYDKQRKEVSKYQDKVKSAQEKIRDYEEKWAERLEKDIEKIQRKIDDTMDKINEKKAELDEKLKVKGTVLRSDILSDSTFAEFSTLDNIKEQIFDGFRSTKETLEKSKQWIEKVYPRQVGKIYENIEKTVTEERNKLMGNYLNDEELFASAMLEDPMEAIKNKYAEKPEMLDSILGEIQEKAEAVKLNMIENIVGNIKIIDDSSLKSMNEKLGEYKGEMEKVRRQDIKNDRQWQKLNETLHKTQGLLQQAASPTYVQSLMEQDRQLQDLTSTYEKLRSELNFIQTADLTNSDNLTNSTERLQSYKDSLKKMLENGLIDSTLLTDNEKLMNKFKDLFNVQIHNLGDTGVGELAGEVDDINTYLQASINFLSKHQDKKYKLDVSVPGVEEFERFNEATKNINIGDLTGDLQEAFKEGDIFTAFKEKVEKAIAGGAISIIEGKNVYNRFKSEVMSGLQDGMDADELQAIWNSAGADLGTAFEDNVNASRIGKSIAKAVGVSLMKEDLDKYKEAVKEARQMMRSNPGMTFDEAMEALGYASGGLVGDRSPVSNFRLNDYDTRHIVANPNEFILSEKGIQTLGGVENTYLVNSGVLPNFNLHEKVMPNFTMPDLGKNLLKGGQPTKETHSKQKVTYEQIIKEKDASKKIEVLIKNEKEKEKRQRQRDNRPIVFNYNGKRSSMSLSKTEIAIIERIAERISSKNVSDTLEEFWS